MFTSIHRALGEEPGPITWQMMEQLVGQRIEETADLDFKKKLPVGQGLWQEEVAKDLSAMANSGGGVIVYGIEEERGRGTAKAIIAQEVQEKDIRALTQIAYNFVQPPLMDLAPIRISDPTENDRAVLALVVPPSSEAPHLFWKQGAFLAPVRQGPDTRWMSEGQIAKAYAERFEGRLRRGRDLTELYAGTAGFIPLKGQVCLVAVASPTGPAGIVGNYPVDAETASNLMRSAIRCHRELIRSDSSVFQRINVTPTVGLRRWRWLASAAERRSQEYLELHRDGSVALTVRIEDLFIDSSVEFAENAAFLDQPIVSSLAIEFAVAALGAAVLAAGEHLRCEAPYEVRAGLSWNKGRTETIPLNLFMSYGRTSHEFQPVVINNYPAVEGTLRHRSAEDLRPDLHLLCLDLLNQAGLDHINLLRG